MVNFISITSMGDKIVVVCIKDNRLLKDNEMEVDAVAISMDMALCKKLGSNGIELIILCILFSTLKRG